MNYIKKQLIKKKNLIWNDEIKQKKILIEKKKAKQNTILINSDLWGGVH